MNMAHIEVIDSLDEDGSYRSVVPVSFCDNSDNNYNGIRSTKESEN